MGKRYSAFFHNFLTPMFEWKVTVTINRYRYMYLLQFDFHNLGTDFIMLSITTDLL